jgi:Tfp pilus assembly protein FimT
MSLSETCLAVAIISTITITAIPSLIQSRDIYLLDAAARQVAGKMHATRIKAISDNRDCRLRITSEVSFSIECQHSQWIPVEHVTTPKGIHITANALPEFHRRGNVSPMATITLSDGRGRQKRVIVNNAGRVRVQ